MAEPNYRPSDIAVIGYSARFPGAADVDEFWRNLREGKHSIQQFTKEELRRHGVPGDDLEKPGYVMAAPILEDIDCFDAAFFGISPREAELMDPQQRLFLEVGWSALEHAGHNVDSPGETVGVFAGGRTNTYLFHLLQHADLLRSIGPFQLGLMNDAGFLSTRLSHCLNLTGPSCAVQTACSTSLVAVHLAVQALLRDECTVALAGGVAVNIPHVTGYLAEDGGVFSLDGYCRVFDAGARGTVFGSGIGAVVLKRLPAAIAARDHIHAVIKGSAVNNDGSVKASFTAPSVRGQVAVIEQALRTAAVPAESIGYVEAHGTGTLLGDAIEVRALTRAFRAETARTGFCALGSVKTNVGHLDAAAGVAGLIKAVKCVDEGVLPPSLHFQEPNPQIKFDDGPFYVNTTLRDWPAGNGPRRAGVSAFGVGGTNAHVIVEQPPAAEPAAESRSSQLVIWSAKTAEAADMVARNLARELRGRAPALADVAYTLQTGRRRMPWRRAIVRSSAVDAAVALESAAFDASHNGDDPTYSRVVFAFPGRLAFPVRFPDELYRQEPVYREAIDRCADALKVERGAAGWPGWPTDAALFSVEYALARLWQSWGVQPAAMVGHGLGEYVAACLSGVWSLEDALEIVVARAAAGAAVAPGALMSVEMDAEMLRAYLKEDLWIAAVDAAGRCSVGGTPDAMSRLEAELRAAGHVTYRLNAERAYQTPLMSPARSALVQAIARAPKGAVGAPYVSSMTGTWVTEALLEDPAYWGDQLCAPVQFQAGIDAALGLGGGIVLEVGPGQELTRLLGRRADSAAYASAGRAGQLDAESILKALARLWVAGIDINWRDFSSAERRRRVPLPTYPFQRKRHWIDAPAAGVVAATVPRPVQPAKIADVKQWCWAQSWQLEPAVTARRRSHANEVWLVFADDCGIGDRISSALQSAEASVVTVRQGGGWARNGDRNVTVAPDSAEDFTSLANLLTEQGWQVRGIVHAWGVRARGRTTDAHGSVDELPADFFSLLHIAREFTDRSAVTRELYVVADDAHAIESADWSNPAKAPAVTFCKVLSQESTMRVRFIDVAAADVTTNPQTVADHVLDEIDHQSTEIVAAVRGRQRWRSTPVRLRMDGSARYPLREGGVYLITGGLGAVGQLIALHLAETCRARVVLLSRTPLPDRASWHSIVQGAMPDDPLASQLVGLQAIEAAGGAVHVLSADVTDVADMRRAIDYCDVECGGLHGIIHAAGVTRGVDLIKLARETTSADCLVQIMPKLKGLAVIDEVIRDRPVDFVLAMSSNAAVLGGLGFLSYGAANAAMDFFVASRSRVPGRTRWLSANWDHWPEEKRKHLDLATSMDEYAMTKAEAVEAVQMLVTGSQTGQIIVATGDLRERLALFLDRPSADAEASVRASERKTALEPRPNLATPYVPPRDANEAAIAAVWAEFLGVGPVGMDDDFFELGGHSLMAITMMSEVSRVLGVEVPLRLLFEGTTVSQLAQGCSKLLESPAPPVS